MRPVPELVELIEFTRFAGEDMNDYGMIIHKNPGVVVNTFDSCRIDTEFFAYPEFDLSGERAYVSVGSTCCDHKIVGKHGMVADMQDADVHRLFFVEHGTYLFGKRSDRFGGFPVFFPESYLSFLLIVR